MENMRYSPRYLITHSADLKELKEDTIVYFTMTNNKNLGNYWKLSDGTYIFSTTRLELTGIGHWFNETSKWGHFPTNNHHLYATIIKKGTKVKTIPGYISVAKNDINLQANTIQIE